MISLAALAGVVVLVAMGGGSRGQHTGKQGDKAAGDKAGAAVKSMIRPLDPSVAKASLGHEQLRSVLGMYNSLDTLGENEEGLLHQEHNEVHRKVELALNHLGLMVDLQDVNAPLPDDETMARYRGVVAWFRGNKMKRPVQYLRWLTRQIQAGRKVVLLNGVGAELDPVGRRTPVAELNQMLAALGMSYHGNSISDSSRIQVVSKDAKMVEFERKLPRRLEPYTHYKLLDPAGQSYLKLRRKDRADSDSDVVLTTSHGGFVAAGMLVRENRLGNNFVRQWHLNPFAFLARAFDLQSMPRADFTTLNGSWIYYSHIDGDGLSNINWINRRDNCGDFTRTQVLEKYDLPVTASFVIAGIAPPPFGLGNRHKVETARRIAALDNIEVGLHGYAHPMNWRARTSSLCSYDIKDYRMNAKREITESAKWINDNLVPAGKRVVTMLWTGWCNPAEDQLEKVYQAGLYNMNGGDPIMDGQYPSYLHLAPLVHKVGKYKQYYTSGPNDYILTEEWTEPHYRWGNLIQTFKNVNMPRRIYPMNVYYHFYVVERASALAGMDKIMQYALSQQPAPMWVSQYIDIVRDFETLRIDRQPELGDEAWRVLNSGFCRTLRFDRMDRHVDLARSKGVLGYRHLNGQKALYVHLDESHDHTVVLASARPAKPYLVRASGYVRAMTLTRDKATLITRGIGRKYLTFANMTPSKRYKVVAKNEKGKVVGGSVMAGPHGALGWQGDINGDKISVTFTLEGAK